MAGSESAGAGRTGAGVVAKKEASNRRGAVEEAVVERKQAEQTNKVLA